jgi:hypothetical protein
MSSTETEQATATDSGEASAQDLANHVAGLSVEQLKQLADEQTDENAKAALQAVIDQREKVEGQLADAKAKEKPKTSRKGTRDPKGRQIAAAKAFNDSAENLARLASVLAEAKQDDGTYVMTPKLIQLGISAYYEERRREEKTTGTKTKKGKDAPIIPAAPEGSAPATPPVVEGAAPAPESAPADAAPAAEAASGGSENSGSAVEAPAEPAAEEHNPYAGDADPA